MEKIINQLKQINNGNFDNAKDSKNFFQSVLDNFYTKHGLDETRKPVIEISEIDEFVGGQHCSAKTERKKSEDGIYRDVIVEPNKIIINSKYVNEIPSTLTRVLNTLFHELSHQLQETLDVPLDILSNNQEFEEVKQSFVELSDNNVYDKEFLPYDFKHFNATLNALKTLEGFDKTPDFETREEYEAYYKRYQEFSEKICAKFENFPAAKQWINNYFKLANNNIESEMKYSMYKYRTYEINARKNGAKFLKEFINDCKSHLEQNNDNSLSAMIRNMEIETFNYYEQIPTSSNIVPLLHLDNLYGQSSQERTPNSENNAKNNLNSKNEKKSSHKSSFSKSIEKLSKKFDAKTAESYKIIAKCLDELYETDELELDDLNLDYNPGLLTDDESLNDFEKNVLTIINDIHKTVLKHKQEADATLEKLGDLNNSNANTSNENGKVTLDTLLNLAKTMQEQENEDLQSCKNGDINTGKLLKDKESTFDLYIHKLYNSLFDIYALKYVENMTITIDTFKLDILEMNNYIQNHLSDLEALKLVNSKILNQLASCDLDKELAKEILNLTIKDKLNNKYKNEFTEYDNFISYFFIKDHLDANEYKELIISLSRQGRNDEIINITKTDNNYAKSKDGKTIDTESNKQDSELYNNNENIINKKIVFECRILAIKSELEKLIKKPKKNEKEIKKLLNLLVNMKYERPDLSTATSEDYFANLIDSTVKTYKDKLMQLKLDENLKSTKEGQTIAN